MNQYYTVYIHRGDTELEVTAQLHDHGQLEEGSESDVGYWSQVIEDPEFHEYTAFDDYGVELTLTPREILDSENQMIKQYWDQYDGVRVVWDVRNKNWDRSYTEIHKAALVWYGKTDLDSCYLAKNRLARGEKPEVKKDE